MRLTREELLQQHTIWNEEKHDIVATMYGDIPLVIYDEEQYKKDLAWAEKDSTIGNISAIDRYIYTQNGAYFKYRTLHGDIYIHRDTNKVLCGEFDIRYNGQVYNIIYNNMYGFNALTISRLSGSGKVAWWCNKDGQSSPCIRKNTTELSDEVIQKVLKHNSLKDYGISVRFFISAVKKMYNSDKTNHISDYGKCWGEDK